MGLFAGVGGVDLDSYLSCLSQPGKRRRRHLKKAIQDSNFDLVFEELKELQDEVEGYKSLRVEQDLLYLKKRSERYYTERSEYVVREKNIEVAES